MVPPISTSLSGRTFEPRALQDLGDELRRAFARPNGEHLVAMPESRFLDGARNKGVPGEAARKIFPKINGHYMFPESPPRLRRHRLPGRLAEAPLSRGVLRVHDEQPAHGPLPGGDSEAGRPTLRRPTYVRNAIPTPHLNDYLNTHKRRRIHITEYMRQHSQ